ncbi:MAG TPA: hypothetical protein PKI19_00985 [Elusimicrobiales bacterium]|nr:hypothetical protein [Elusimicrobiales bacterium]
MLTGRLKFSSARFCLAACAAALLPAPCAAAGLPETPPIEIPGATIQQTLAFVYKAAHTANVAALKAPRRGARPAVAALPALASVRWLPESPDTVHYFLYLKDLEAKFYKGKKYRPGSVYQLLELTAAPAFARKLSPYKLVKMKSAGSKDGLLFGKDLAEIRAPFKDISEVIGELQLRLHVDLALAARRQLCSSGSPGFMLAPRFELSNRAGFAPGYSGTLELAARAKKPYGEKYGKAGCREYSGLDVFADQYSGSYLVSDYNDGFVYAEYAAGELPPVKAGKDKKEEARSRLRRAFSLMDSLFGAALEPGVRLRRTIAEGAAGLPPELPPTPQEEKVSRVLDTALARERAAEIEAAVKLSSSSPMAHAALGLLLSHDCELKKPARPGNCEKGIKELVKALELEPGLAFPSYVLARRAGAPAFPAKLRALLPADVPALCESARGNAPDWDWALRGTCALAALRRGDAAKAREHLDKARDITVLRPGDLLGGYLARE